MSGRRRAPAVVIGLDSATGLQSARILARRGIPVIGVASDANHACCRTNVCASVVTADIDGPSLVDTLERLGPQLVPRATTAEPAVLFPCTDGSVLALSRGRSRLRPWYRFALPDEDVIELLADKELFYRYAQREGLPIPPTEFLGSRNDALRAADTLRFPCVLKPPLKTPEWRSQARAKAFVAASPTELLDLYDELSPHARCLIAQSLVEGPDREHYTCNGYFDERSRPLVTFVSRKLRQWPPGVGEGCLSEEARNDVVLEATVSLFRGLGHHGLGYLEMKRDRETGEYVIIEPNVGRPTGRSSNAEAAGVELLHTQYCDLLGRPLPASRWQRYQGVKWVHTRRDLQSAIHYMRRGELGLGEWLESLRGPRFHAVLSRRDPKPFFADLVRVGRALRGREGGQGAATNGEEAAKEVAHEVVQVAPTRAAASATARRPRREGRDGAVRILTYHRVIDPRHPSVGHAGLVSATPGVFERQMRYLARRYDVVSAARVLDALHGEARLPPRPVLITFDDAYVDFAEVAWPILRQHGLPATLFVPTAYPDDPHREFWWDRLYRAVSSTPREDLLETPLGRLDLRPERRRATLSILQDWVKSLPHPEALEQIDVLCDELGIVEARPAPVLGWDALRRLAAEGVTLAPHTRTHPALDRLPLAAAEAEVLGSREDLEREVGSCAPIFAYPFGSWDDRLTELLRKERFGAAVTQEDGLNAMTDANPFLLRRTNMTRRTSAIALAFRLTSIGARFDAWRHASPRLVPWSEPAPGRA